MIEPNKSMYKAFGLRISSDIHMPELPRTDEAEGNPDLVIETADLSKRWSELVPVDSNFVAEKDLFMVEAANAKFCIKAGAKITVSPPKGADEEELRLIILGLCISALLMQRKVIPLHGSALAINGKAYGFVGDSGAGKSTIASAFLSRGYRLLTDDLMAVSFSPDNTPMVIPAYPQQKLWQETLLEFGETPENYRPIYQRHNKYAIPVTSKFYSEPLPLGGIFEIVKTEDDTEEIRPVQRLEKLHTLFTHTYANFLVTLSESRAWHFEASSNIARQIDFYQLRRPVSRFTADDFVSQVLNLLHQEE